MIYVLKIGYLSFAFPTSRGLQTVMDVPGKARELKRGFMPGLDKPEEMELSEVPVSVSMHCVQGVSFVSGKRAGRRDVIEPEVLPREPGESDAVFAMRASRDRNRTRYSLPPPSDWGRVTSGRPRLELGEGR